VSVDFASVFRVLTTTLGLTAIVAAVAALAGFGGDALLLLALMCALASLGFRLAARGAGRPSRERVSLVGASVIAVVLGCVLIFLVLFIWAIDGAFG